LKVFGEVSITELSILKESTPVVIVPTALRTSKKKNMIVQLHQRKARDARLLMKGRPKILARKG
jgi:hypothetical protein